MPNKYELCPYLTASFIYFICLSIFLNVNVFSQVYIVAMVNDGHTTDYTTTIPAAVDEDESDEDFGKFESKGESLLTLVQPELSSLAEHWLAALRDHALLMLPPGNLFVQIHSCLSDKRNLSHVCWASLRSYTC